MYMFSVKTNSFFFYCGNVSGIADFSNRSDEHATVFNATLNLKGTKAVATN